MIHRVLIASVSGLLAASPSSAQEVADQGRAKMEQIAPLISRAQAGRERVRSAPGVAQLTRRREGDIVVATPGTRPSPDLSQLTQANTGVRLAAPPAGAVDLCSSHRRSPPPGLDCDAVLEAVAASAPPETRLLEPAEPPAVRGETPGRNSTVDVDADQVAKQLQTGVLAGSSVAQAVAASRGAPATSSPTPDAPTP